MSQNATFNQPWSFFVVSIDRSPVHPQHNGRVFSDGRPLSLYLIIINEAEDVVFRLMDGYHFNGWLRLIAQQKSGKSAYWIYRLEYKFF